MSFSVKDVDQGEDSYRQGNRDRHRAERQGVSHSTIFSVVTEGRAKLAGAFVPERLESALVVPNSTGRVPGPVLLKLWIRYV